MGSTVLGGVVYYSYPYLTLLSSLVSCAAHFAFKLDQSLRSLLLSSITDSRNLTILLGHWALHAYGILAITELRQLSLHLSLLTLVPLPALFYILTARSQIPPGSATSTNSTKMFYLGLFSPKYRSSHCGMLSAANCLPGRYSHFQRYYFVAKYVFSN